MANKDFESVIDTPNFVSKLAKMTSDLFVHVAGSNPGAMIVLMSLVDTVGIEPSIGYVSQLKKWGVIGSNIWILYKDVSDSNMQKFIAILNRICSESVPVKELKRVIKSHGGKFDE